MNDMQREAFERHLITCLEFSKPGIMIHRTETGYDHVDMQENWKTWQAAIRHMREQEDKA